MGCCLERGADLHMAQLTPLPLTVSCFSKIQIGFTFLVPAHPGSPGQRAVKRVCVCVCVCVSRRQPAHSDYSEDAGVLFDSVICTVSVPCRQQRHAPSSILLQQNHPLLNWWCRLTRGFQPDASHASAQRKQNACV